MKETAAMSYNACRAIGVYDEMRRLHGRSRSLFESVEDLKNWRLIELILAQKVIALRRRAVRTARSGGVL